MTIEEFAAVTPAVIAREGFADFLPTVCYPDRQDLRTLAGLPADIEPEPAVLKWALKNAEPDELFLIAFKTGPTVFTIVRQQRGKRESASFEIG